MIKLKKCAVSLILFVFINSCNQNTNYSVKTFSNESADSLIFGVFAGMATPNYSTVFKYSKNELYVDTIDSYYFKSASSNPNNYNWVKLPLSDSTISKNLLTSVPFHYYKVDSIFGSPDNVDQGGAFIIFYKFNIKTEIKLDNFRNNIPKDLEPVLDSINLIVQKLRKGNKINQGEYN
jgi:hypothetical protein